MKKIRLVVLLIFVLTFALMPTVQAQSPQQTLNQYISDLQKNPNDYALREKIIKLVQTLKPAPVIPEEARRHYVMALTLFKGAKKIEDYSESIEEFKSALLVAPWWAEANRDLGMALEATKRYDDAISALKLYMASSPGEEKARAAQDEIYKIEGMKKLAAREKQESSPQAVAAREQNKFEDWLKKIDGARYTRPMGYPPGNNTNTFVIDVRGTVAIFGLNWVQSGYEERRRFEIRGRETTVPCDDIARRAGWKESIYVISEDGDRITVREVKYNGSSVESIYLRER